MLQNGDVLVIGGDKHRADLRPWPGAVLPAEESIPMTAPRFAAVAARLQDGTVLIAGGSSHVPSAPMNAYDSAEIFDPASKSFAATGAMQEPRVYPAAVTLVSGKVLVSGGADPTGFTSGTGAVPLRSADVYDPATRLFHAVGPMGRGRGSHSLTRLASGEVLVTGGCAAVVPVTPCPAEIFDPKSETFTTIA